MAKPERPDKPEDSTGKLGRRLEIENEIADRIMEIAGLSFRQQEELIEIIEARLENEDFWAESDQSGGDEIGVPVRSPWPAPPKGASRIAVRPDLQSDPGAEDSDHPQLKRDLPEGSSPDES